MTLSAYWDYFEVKDKTYFLIDEHKKKDTILLVRWLSDLLQSRLGKWTICDQKYYYLYNLFRTTSYNKMSNFPWQNCLFYFQYIYLKCDRIMEEHSKENRFAALWMGGAGNLLGSTSVGRDRKPSTEASTRTRVSRSVRPPSGGKSVKLTSDIEPLPRSNSSCTISAWESLSRKLGHKGAYKDHSLVLSSFLSACFPEDILSEYTHTHTHTHTHKLCLSIIYLSSMYVLSICLSIYPFMHTHIYGYT